MKRRKIIEAENKLNPIEEDLMGIGAPLEVVFQSISDAFVAQYEVWGLNKVDEQRLQTLIIGYTKSELAYMLLTKMHQITELKNELKKIEEFNKKTVTKLANQNHAEN